MAFLPFSGSLTPFQMFNAGTDECGRSSARNVTEHPKCRFWIRQVVMGSVETGYRLSLTLHCRAPNGFSTTSRFQVWFVLVSSPRQPPDAPLSTFSPRPLCCHLTDLQLAHPRIPNCQLSDQRANPLLLSPAAVLAKPQLSSPLLPLGHQPGRCLGRKFPKKTPRAMSLSQPNHSPTACSKILIILFRFRWVESRYFPAYRIWKLRLSGAARPMGRGPWACRALWRFWLAAASAPAAAGRLTPCPMSSCQEEADHGRHSLSDQARSPIETLTRWARWGNPWYGHCSGDRIPVGGWQGSHARSKTRARVFVAPSFSGLQIAHATIDAALIVCDNGTAAYGMAQRPLSIGRWMLAQLELADPTQESAGNIQIPLHTPCKTALPAATHPSVVLFLIRSVLGHPAQGDVDSPRRNSAVSKHSLRRLSFRP